MYREQYGEYAYWCQGVEGYEGYCLYIFDKGKKLSFQSHWDGTFITLFDTFF